MEVNHSTADRRADRLPAAAEGVASGGVESYHSTPLPPPLAYLLPRPLSDLFIQPDRRQLQVGSRVTGSSPGAGVNPLSASSVKASPDKGSRTLYP